MTLTTSLASAAGSLAVVAAGDIFDDAAGDTASAAAGAASIAKMGIVYSSEAMINGGCILVRLSECA